MNCRDVLRFLKLKLLCLQNNNAKIHPSFSCIDKTIIAHTVYVFRTKRCFAGPRFQCLLGSLGAKCGRLICLLTPVSILI